MKNLDKRETKKIQNVSKPAVASTRSSLYLFKWKHLGEHVVMAHGLVTTSEDGQHLCVRGHQKLRDKRKKPKPHCVDHDPRRFGRDLGNKPWQRLPRLLPSARLWWPRHPWSAGWRREDDRQQRVDKSHLSRAILSSLCSAEVTLTALVRPLSGSSSNTTALPGTVSYVHKTLVHSSPLLAM